MAQWYRISRRQGFDLGSGRSPGGGNDNPFQYSCLENFKDRGAWPGRRGGGATVQEISNSHTHLMLNIHGSRKQAEGEWVKDSNKKDDST